MPGIFSRILNPQANGDKLVDAAISVGDKLFYTKEEKAEVFPKLLELYEPFKLAQRILAIMFSSIFIFNFLVGEVLFLFFNEDKAQIIWTANIDTFGYSVLLIVGFYFAGGVVNPAAKRLTGWIREKQVSTLKDYNKKGKE